MRPIKVVFIIAHINKSLQFEWMIEGLLRRNFSLSFILLGEATTELSAFIVKNHLLIYNIELHNSRGLFRVFFKVVSLLKKIKPDVVHTHLYHANLTGLLAAKITGVKKRIYTRHHATIHLQHFPKAVFADKFINSLATDIIIPSLSLYDVLVKLEGAQPEKIHHIPHGFNLGYFSNRDESAVASLRTKYNLSGHPVVGVIARHVEWKGVQYIIPAFKEVLKKYTESHLILANVGGDFKNEITSLLSDLPDRNYSLICFESNAAALYHCFDLFVHVPVDRDCEAFGQTYVEALASGVPSVFTLSGIGNEFLRDRENALIVRYRDSEAIYTALIGLIEDPLLANGLREKGKAVVNERFSVDKMIDRLSKLYITSE
ncbi:glycosyltransferase [soil metagenome]